MGGLFEQFRSATCWWIGGRRYDGVRNRGLVGCVLLLHLHPGIGKNRDLHFSFFSSLDNCLWRRNDNYLLLFRKNPDKLSRPRTRKSRLGRWRKFLLFNACLFFSFNFSFLFCE
jgi:hypothetical protein